VGVQNDFFWGTDKLKYQQQPEILAVAHGPEIMTIKFRYKKPDEEKSKLIVHPVIDQHLTIGETSNNFRFVSAIAEFGMLLRNSEFKQQSSFNNILTLAKDALGSDGEGYRAEFLGLVGKAEKAAGRKKGG
jgi:Ca-activated chloride channel family protein